MKDITKSQEYKDGWRMYELNGDDAECPYPKGPPQSDERVRWFSGFIAARTKSRLGYYE